MSEVVVGLERRHVLGPGDRVCVRCGAAVAPERWPTEFCPGPQGPLVAALKRELFNLFLEVRPGPLKDKLRVARQVVKRGPTRLERVELDSYVAVVRRIILAGTPRPEGEAGAAPADGQAPAQAAEAGQAADGATAQAAEAASAQAAPPAPPPAALPMHCGAPMKKLFPNVGRGGAITWVWCCAKDCGFQWRQPAGPA